MVTPLDVIPSFHQALRNDMQIIDDAAYKAAAEAGDLAPAVGRLRFFTEILKWHADGEDELVFPAMEKVAPLVGSAYLHDHNEFDLMTAGLAKITASSDTLVAARETAALTEVLRIHLDKEDQLLYPILRERTSAEEQAAIEAVWPRTFRPNVIPSSYVGFSRYWDTMTGRCGSES